MKLNLLCNLWKKSYANGSIFESTMIQLIYYNSQKHRAKFATLIPIGLVAASFGPYVHNLIIVDSVI